MLCFALALGEPPTATHHRAGVVPRPGTHRTTALRHGKDSRPDVPSSPPGLAGAVAAQSQRRQGQGSAPCFSPCDAYVWARSPHRQRDLEAKSGAAAAGVARSQGRASGRLWEERSSSPTVGGDGGGSFPLAGVPGKPRRAAALSRARTVLPARPELTLEAHVRSGGVTACGEVEGLTSKGSQPLHDSRKSPGRRNALSGSASCGSHKRTEPPLPPLPRGRTRYHCDITAQCHLTGNGWGPGSTQGSPAGPQTQHLL